MAADVRARGGARSAVVVGGGRWGAVLCRELLEQRPSLDEVHWVSTRNHRGAGRVAAEVNAALGAPRVVVWSELDACLAFGPAAGVVANLPAQHAATASALLECGIPTLVEKPVTRTRGELHDLVSLAARTDVPVLAGLEYLVAPAVRRFARVAAAHAEPTQVTITWHDVAGDRTAAGVRRRFDWTTNVVADVYPHVLSILRSVVGLGPVVLDRCTVAAGGWEAALSLNFAGIPVTVSLSRIADVPRRTIELDLPDEGRLVLDFTRGTALAALRDDPIDLRWPADGVVDDRTPLAIELDALLDPFERDRSALALDATAPLHLAVLDAADAVAESQRRLLRTAVAHPAVDDDIATDATRAMAELILPSLLDAGAVTTDEEAQIARWCRSALHVVSDLAGDAFARQRDVAARVGMTRDELVSLNAALRSSPLTHELITEAGAAAKYWTNTVVPLQRAGVVDDAAARRPRYPFRVGIYPGPSCMFFCTFCGRDYDARYERASIETGNQILTRTLAQAPADDLHRFYISGGLEPLTNPGIGALVRAGADRGFRLSLYTNGLLLTPAVLRRQPGLWDLDSLRISLYGPDAASFLAVTRKPNAFHHVVSNAKTFLSLRAERDSSTKLGFNYVVLPGQSAKVLDVLDLVAEINRDGGGRPIDFLTLREDYSVPNGGFDEAEREALRETLLVMDARLAERDLASLTVDYGYGLDALRRGFETSRLCFVGEDEVRADGYPQVSVVVDLLGDVYLYREAGFLDRPGARRYVIGRIDEEQDLGDVVAEFVRSGGTCEVEPGDTKFFDVFDHVVTSLLHQADDDARFGVPPSAGPFARTGTGGVVLAHPTLPR